MQEAVCAQLSRTREDKGGGMESLRMAGEARFGRLGSLLTTSRLEIDDVRALVLEGALAEGDCMAESASMLIDAKIQSLGDWRGTTLAKVRALIREADPEIVEEWKWRGVPVWSRGGIVCTGETYKNVVKMTFAKGASLEDPVGLFNSSLEGNVRRAIDLHEGDGVDEASLKELIRAAVALNVKSKKKA